MGGKSSRATEQTNQRNLTSKQQTFKKRRNKNDGTKYV